MHVTVHRRSRVDAAALEARPAPMSTPETLAADQNSGWVGQYGLTRSNSGL